MNDEHVTLALALAILVLSGPVVAAARAISRRKEARHTAAVARELGLDEWDPRGVEARPLLGGGGRRAVASAIGGTYQGRGVVLAEFEDRPSPGPLGWRRLLASAIERLGRRPPEALSRGPRGPRSLVILFADPTPGLPGFRLRPRSAAERRRGIDRPEGEAGASPDGPSAPGLVLAPEEARPGLPAAFLDRASRVLAGRPRGWSVEGAEGRLLVRIEGWRGPAAARTYRAILDDAFSLRAAFDPAEAVPGAAGPRSIRAALERIREAPRPDGEGP